MFPTMTIASMNPAAIQWLTIHCTATPEGRANTAAEVTAWDIERFGQPSYHRVFCLDGSVHQTLREDQRGAHTGGHNTGNIGFSYVGGTECMNAGGKPKDTRTAAQKAALEREVRDFLKRHPHAKIRGHREWPGVAKACPSFDVRAWLKSIGLGAYSA
jgi:N-acetylmuramoyl-L-alanine amidase